MIVKLLVELEIEADSAEDAYDAVNDVLDSGAFQNDLNEWFEEHVRDAPRGRHEAAPVRAATVRKEGP